MENLIIIRRMVIMTLSDFAATVKKARKQRRGIYRFIRKIPKDTDSPIKVARIGNNVKHKIKRKNRKIAIRFRNINIALLALAFCIMAAVMAITFSGVINQLSYEFTGRYATSSAETLSAIMDKELGLLAKAAHSNAVIDWLQDENDSVKKMLAYDEMMGIVGELYSFNLYIGIDESLHEYRIEKGRDAGQFNYFAVLNSNSDDDAWFFTSESEDIDYSLIVGIDRVMQRKRIWLNHKVLRDGKVLGIICTGLDFSSITGELFSDYKSNNLRGLLVDRNGDIHIDSEMMNNKNFMRFDYIAHIDYEFADPTLLAVLKEHISGFGGGSGSAGGSGGGGTMAVGAGAVVGSSDTLAAGRDDTVAAGRGDTVATGAGAGGSAGSVAAVGLTVSSYNIATNVATGGTAGVAGSPYNSPADGTWPIKLKSGPYRYLASAPIRNTTWTVVILSGTHSLFNLNLFFPVSLTLLILLVAFALATSTINYRLIFMPLGKLDRSLALLKENIEIQIYGSEREDELGELSKTIQDLFSKANFDTLTGLYNRRFMENNLLHVIEMLSRSNSMLSTLMVDIDYFKRYNDTFGHDQGDVCLRKVAGALAGGVTRANDFAARYGGEEFVVVLPNTGEIGARVVAEKLLNGVRDLQVLHPGNDAVGYVTVSIGVTSGMVTYMQSWEDYIKLADKALYMSKKNGRNQYTYLPFLNQTSISSR